MREMTDMILKGEEFSSLFEVGVGSGYYLADAYASGLKVGGLDIEQENIDTTRVRFPNCRDNFVLHDANIRPWGIKHRSYDIVFTVGTLFLLKEPFNALIEMAYISEKAQIFAEPETPEILHMIDTLRKMGAKVEVKGHALGKIVIKLFKDNLSL